MIAVARSADAERPGDPVSTPSPEKPPAPPAAVPAAGHDQPPVLRILVVEDDPDIREALCSVLGDEGFATVAAADGSQALEILRGGLAVDLVVLDLMMPVMDGWQFRLAQKRNPLLAQIPVLAISANPSAKAAAIDAAAYLSKPFDFDTLISTVRRVLLAFERRGLQEKQPAATPGSGAAPASEVQRLRNAFISNLSHELRTPLGAVLSLTELLLDDAAGPLTGEQRRYLEVIARNGRALLELVSDVLDIADLIEGRLQLSLGALAPADLLEAVVAKLGPSAAAKGLELSLDIRGALPLVRGDAHRVRQVAMHLVGNAIKYTVEGAVRVAAETRAGMVAVSICDSGIGIPAEALERIFEEFAQVDDRSTRRHQGAGLGLALAGRLVRLMGGELSVKSAVGAGSCFTFTLPRA
jgi:signal transduction histidine kinase